MREAIRPTLARLQTEMSERRNRPAPSSRDFFLRALDVIAGVRKGSCDELRLACAEECAKFFFHVTDSASMLRAVHLFLDVASASGKRHWLRKAQTFCAIAYADTGNNYEALKFYSDALKTARELGRGTSDEAFVLSNMGTALMFAGLYTDAMRAFQRTYELATDKAALSRLASSAATNMALVCYRQGQFELGIRHIKHAVELGYQGAPAEEVRLHDAIVESIYVQLAVGLGDSGLADERLARCQAIAMQSQAPRTIWVAKLARGLCELDHGDAPNGISILKNAVDLMKPLSDSWVDGHIFLIRGLEKLGRVEEALSYADQLGTGLNTLCRTTLHALTQHEAFACATLRPDQLHSLEQQRSRLRMAVAERVAAQAKWEAIERLAMTAQLRDDTTGLHGHRVGRLARLFAEHLRLRHDVIEQLEVAGRLHDVGKMGIPDHVLRSGAVPTRAERELLNAHTRIGADLLAQSAIPEIQCAELVARYHHERWDGEGYPARMRGKRIPVECRIIAIADCFDAMTHGRPHARPVSPSVALGEVLVQKGKHFDPQLADAFVSFMRTFLAEHPDASAYLEQSARQTPLTNAMRELGDLLAAVSEEKRERPARRRAAPPARAQREPSTRSPEPL